MARQKIGLIILIIIVITASFSVAATKEVESNFAKSNPPAANKAVDDLVCPYYVDVGAYKSYVRTLNEFEVTGRPQVIEDYKIIKINEPFDQNELEKVSYHTTHDNGLSEARFDVDGDGIDEQIISEDIAMNHTPNVAMIVKNGKLIFKRGGYNIVIKPALSGHGFVLDETIDWNIGETKSTTYLSKDGGFLPIWTQKHCWVNFNEPDISQ